MVKVGVCVITFLYKWEIFFLMDLKIFGLMEAVDYQPINPTYVIRIGSKRSDFKFALQESGLYTVVEYLFDDNDPTRWGKLSKNSITIDEVIARSILSDFKEKGLDKETLLVHCSMGKNRSPAVGIALNEIYNLGHNTEELKKRFPEANWYVYETLLKVAEES